MLEMKVFRVKNQFEKTIGVFNVRVPARGDLSFLEEPDFGLRVKNGKIYFDFKNDKHIFGSKTYPVGKKGLSLFFNQEAESEFREVSDTIERSNWKHRNGYCYTNAEILLEAFHASGVEAKYFSGWVFTGVGYPVHHAWVVVGDKVYDLSIHLPSIKKITEQNLEGKNPYDKKSVAEVKALKDVRNPIHENFVWGVVPELMIYVGSEETPTSARAKYNTAMKNTPNHPSYRSMAKKVGDEVHYKTRYQHLMDE